jgi:NAD-dependent SIR2 family protein deacetylase
MTDVKIRELDWYLRDHLFRQSNKGRQEFEQRMLPSEIIKTYLRYRNENIDQISQLVDTVIGNLLHQHVINKKNGDLFELRGTLRRLQCSKCYYISYLAEEEELACLRCNSTSLEEFPKKSLNHTK